MGFKSFVAISLSKNVKLTSSPNESSTKLSPVAPNCESSAIVTLLPVILMVHSLSLVGLTEITEMDLDNSARCANARSRGTLGSNSGHNRLDTDIRMNIQRDFLLK